MALTRKMLEAMGIEEEKIDQIMEAHAETVDALKEQRDTYKADAEKLPAVQKELDGLKEGGDGGYKEKYEAEHKAFSDYKEAQTAKESRAAREKAVRSYLESRNIKGANLTIALRGLNAEIDGAELDGDKLKDTKPFDALIAGDFAGLVSTTETQGAPTSNPPANQTRHVYTPAEIRTMTPAQINENFEAIKASLKGANQ